MGSAIGAIEARLKLQNPFGMSIRFKILYIRMTGYLAKTILRALL